MAKPTSKLHAIVIPVPYQGHINPAIALAIKLASKGITVTFIHTRYVHDTLTKIHHDNTRNEVDFFSEARKSGLDIRYSTISDGFPMDFDRGLHYDVFWDSLLRDFPARVDEFVGNMILFDPSSTFFLIVDTFFSWSTTIAKKYSLVNVSFWTQTALALSIGYHLDLLSQNGHLPTKDNVEEEITYLPGIEAISTKDLMAYLKESETTTKAHYVSTKAFEEVKKADFILCNIVEELEFHALSALKQKQPTYAVGPVNFIRDCTPPTITRSLWAESDCEKWLQSKRPGSVLYVSFGSLAQISKQEIQEIAYGLLLSEVNFIWVVRADIVSFDESHALPDGFEDDAKDKGLIVPWCDQINVLSNPAVGLFLTHCGWNSIVESIWCGVPMICHPFIYDQPTNRKLIVEDLKVGINLLDGVSVHREEVAEKIKNSMSGPVGLRLRQEVEKAKIISHNAIEVNGSSHRNLEQFIQDLVNKIRS
ncbi:UDP-glycosyltransferase 86A1-like [Primulina huaijiensis]|uniref:UDP-glycosyltransferase 86A1-like n=1 Tax=Primulina huaijiensis TaxID=1492673 RepID=UPI003CC6F435